MAMKMQRILDDESAEGRKKQKQMANLVIGREENNKEISLEFKTSASRERFRKMMNESVELDEMKKSDGPFTVVALKGKKVVGQLRNVEHYDIELAIDMMRKDKQGAKISVESKKGKVVHTEGVEIDESVKIMFKGFDMEQRVFTAKLKKFGFDKEYRKMMQNFMKHANSGDGFYFIDGGRELGFQVHPVSDMMMGNKIKKLGDKQDLGGGKTATLIAIKEDMQVNEMSPFNVMGGKKTATPRKMGRDLENRLKMTKPSEYTFSAPAAGGGTFAVIPIKTSRPSSQAGVMMATFDKRGKVLAYYGTHMDTDAAKKFAKKEGLIESVQLDEGSEIEFKFSNPMKAGAFMRRIMRDKLASEVDRYDGDRSPEEIVQVIMHPNDYERNDIERLAKQYKGQLRETNFRFPQPGEDYGEFGMSINDPDSFSGSGPSRSELRKRSRDIERKFASVMRKHKRTKVGEVLDLLDKDGGTKLYKDSDIKQINKYLTKHKDNVRKVAHQMMIDVMQGDDYLAKKRIPIKEERVPTYVIDRKTKKIVHGPTDAADSKLYLDKQITPRKFMIRQIRGAAKKVGDTV